MKKLRFPELVALQVELMLTVRSCPCEEKRKQLTNALPAVWTVQPSLLVQKYEALVTKSEATKETGFDRFVP